MSSVTIDPRTRQQSTSHILKTGKRGNPFVKDTHDLFSTLVASLQLTTNSRFFRSYPNSFTTDDAAANLSSLRFSQSNRSTDPNDPSRIVTTTTTTTFSMNRDIAKGICQHFMDARLIENAADPLNPTFKERGIYQITPKGLHVLERFITKNGIHADHLVRVFTTQPICMKLLHLERRPTDDEIHITPSVVNVIFKRFSGGRNPNYLIDPSEVHRNTTAKPFTDNPRITPNYDRSLGVELQDVRERTANGTTLLIKHVFSSTVAIDWLVDFSTCCGREEAAEVLGHFVRYGLITVHIDRSKGADKVAHVNVRAPSDEVANPGVALEASFKYGSKVTYRITDEGRRISGVDGLTDRANKPAGSTNGTRTEDDQRSLSHYPSQSPVDQIATGNPIGLFHTTESQNEGRQVLRDILHTDPSDGSAWVKDATSSTARLKAILNDPALRSLFRDFLRSHICEENLHYWIDVQEFRRRFATSSSAVGVGPLHHSKKKPVSSSLATSAMEQHQEKLVTTALSIFNTYLAPGSPSELNIDHNLRADVISYMSRAVDEAKAMSDQSEQSEASIPALRATQVQALLRHYERIADHIYRLMATDQVPKFVRTERFLEILSAQQLDESGDTDSATTMAPAGFGEVQGAVAGNLLEIKPVKSPSKHHIPSILNKSPITSTSMLPERSQNNGNILKPSTSYKKLIGSTSNSTAASSPTAPSSSSSPPSPHYRQRTNHSNNEMNNNNRVNLLPSSSSCNNFTSNSLASSPSVNHHHHRHQNSSSIEPSSPGFSTNSRSNIDPLSSKLSDTELTDS